MNPDWFGARVRELREQAGLTQQQLAEKMGVQRLAVARWETGTREPNWSTILALCEVLGVDCTAFTQEPAAAEPRPRGRPRKPAAEPDQIEPATPETLAEEKPTRKGRGKKGT